MTDTKADSTAPAETTPAATPALPKRRWFPRFRSSFQREAWMNFGRKYDAHIYMVVVAAGLPLMAALIQNFQAKLSIACVWFALGPILYFWLEGMEMNAQIEKYGLLKQQDSDSQRETMFFPYFGAAIAFVIWLLVDAVSVAVYLTETWQTQTWDSITGHILLSPWTTPLRYAEIEWSLLVHTVVVGALTIRVYFPLMSNFLQATAGQKRFEEKVQ